LFDISKIFFFFKKMSNYLFNTGFIELFKEYGIKYPIVQAPMAGVVDAKLVSEVYSAGGLGFLPAGRNLKF
jgi:hypothetical protein